MYIKNRIKLLPDEEIDAIYMLPVFNEVEQALYFDFTEQELAVAKRYRTIKAQISFMLSLGHFKAKQQLYRVNLSLSQDVRSITTKYFENIGIDDLSGRINKETYGKQKADLLALFGYQN